MNYIFIYQIIQMDLYHVLMESNLQISPFNYIVSCSLNLRVIWKEFNSYIIKGRVWSIRIYVKRCSAYLPWTSIA